MWHTPARLETLECVERKTTTRDQHVTETTFDLAEQHEKERKESDDVTCTESSHVRVVVIVHYAKCPQIVSQTNCHIAR